MAGGHLRITLHQRIERALQRAVFLREGAVSGHVMLVEPFPGVDVVDPDAVPQVSHVRDVAVVGSRSGCGAARAHDDGEPGPGRGGELAPASVDLAHPVLVRERGPAVAQVADTEFLQARDDDRAESGAVDAIEVAQVHVDADRRDEVLGARRDQRFEALVGDAERGGVGEAPHRGDESRGPLGARGDPPAIGGAGDRRVEALPADGVAHAEPEPVAVAHGRVEARAVSERKGARIGRDFECRGVDARQQRGESDAYRASGDRAGHPGVTGVQRNHQVSLQSGHGAVRNLPRGGGCGGSRRRP